MAELEEIEREYNDTLNQHCSLPSREFGTAEDPTVAIPPAVWPVGTHSGRSSVSDPRFSEHDHWLHFDEKIAIFGGRLESAFFVQDSPGVQRLTGCVQRTHGAFAL